MRRPDVERIKELGEQWGCNHAEVRYAVPALCDYILHLERLLACAHPEEPA